MRCKLCNPKETYYEDSEMVIMKLEGKVVGTTKKHLRNPNEKLKLNIVAKLVEVMEKEFKRLPQVEIIENSHWHILAE